MFIKDQAQKFIGEITKGIVCKKEFDDWVLEMNKNNVEFIVRTRKAGTKSIINCVTPAELYSDLVINAVDSIIETVINANTTCDDCPWNHECL